jgi:hypothetical protein
MIDAQFCARLQKSVVIHFSANRAQVNPRAMTSHRDWRHSIRAGLPAINPPKLATASTHFCLPGV